MLKEHPKGLLVLFFSNMGERFGYYTVISIFILFMGARLGWSEESIGDIWGYFLAAVYALPVVGGLLADRIGYGKTVALGIVLMITGYALMAIPGTQEAFIFSSLAVIALGTGLFKGNLVVILGNLYEQNGLKKLQDAAFNIFYMGINIGAFFAPFAATGMRDWLLGRDGFTYDANLPGMAHQFLQGSLESTAKFQSLAEAQLQDQFTTLHEFARQYLDSLSASYNAGFGVAAVSIVVSLLIFLGFRKYYKHADYLQSKKKQAGEAVIELTPQQTRDRLMALGLVFFVVIFFWMAFHQNGLTLTWFAKNYTVGSVGSITKIFFDLPAFLGVIGAIIGLIFLIGRRFSGGFKGIGSALVLAGIAVAYWRYTGFQEDNPIAPELFQSFNPIFVVFLTPLILGVFAYLNRKNKEPSAPRKIAIGMVIASTSFILMVFASMSLASPAVLKTSGGVSSMLVTPYWLISTYFVLTVAELFLSPMGLSFVARVSPPKYRGLMQGCWLGATAVGNYLSGQVAIPYARLELWHTFALLVGCCALSAVFMFAILKKLERAIQS